MCIIHKGSATVKTCLGAILSELITAGVPLLALFTIFLFFFADDTVEILEGRVSKKRNCCCDCNINFTNWKVK